MSIFDWFSDFFTGGGLEDSSSFSGSSFSDSDMEAVNPASGLPMMGDGIGGVDVAGNPYGMDSSSFDAFDSFGSSSFDSFGGGSFDSFGSSFDDW